MTAATLTQFLIDITRGHRSAEFAADPIPVLAASALDEPTRAAVRDQDIGTLWQAGAHPMALLYFARACGWANDRYYRCLADADLRKAAPAPAAPRADDGPSQTHRSNARHAR